MTENAERVGAHLMSMQAEYCVTITDVRGMGLMLAVECTSGEIASRVVESAFQSGLLLLTAGSRAVRICPPLTLTVEEADTAIDILRSVLAKL